MKILTERHDGDVSRVASSSFGFGGTNACLVFDKFEAPSFSFYSFFMIYELI